MRLKGPKVEIHPRLRTLLDGKPPQERPSYVEMVARQSGAEEIADAVAAGVPSRSWSVPWAHCGREGIFHLLGRHSGSVVSVAIGKAAGRPLAVSATADGIIRGWDLRTRQPVGSPIRGPSRLNAVAVTELGGRPVAVSCGDDETLRVWDLESQQPIGDPLCGHTGKVRKVAVGELAGHAVAVSCGEESALRVWDLESQQPIGDRLVHAYVQSVAVGELRGRPVAVSCGTDSTVHVWDLESQQVIGIPLRGHLGKVLGVAVGQIGERAVAVSSGADETIRVWDLESQQPICEPVDGQCPQAIAMCSMAGRAYVAWPCTDGLRLWDPETGTQQLLPYHYDRIQAIAMSAIDHRVLVVSGDNAGAVRLWLGDQLEEGRQADWNSDLLAHNADSFGWTQAVAASHSGNRPIAVAAPHRGLFVWDLSTGRQVRVPGSKDDPIPPINAVTVAEIDGQPIILAGHDGGVLSRWDPDRGRLPWPHLPFGHAITALATANLHGRPFLVAGAENGALRQWDLTSLQPVRNFPGRYGPVTGLTVGELNGQALLVAGHRNGQIEAWDLVNEETIWEFRCRSRCWCLATGAVGNEQVLACGDGSSIIVADLASGERRSALQGHSGEVYGVAVTEFDGKPALVSAGRDSTVRLWDLEAMALIIKIDVGGTVYNMAAGPLQTTLIGQYRGVTAIRFTGGSVPSREHGKAQPVNWRDKGAEGLAEKMVARSKILERLGAELSGIYDDALAYLNVAVMMNPTSLSCLQTRGIVHAKIGRHQKAHADFTPVLKARPDDTELLFSDAIECYHLLQFVNAANRLDRLLGISPRDKRSLYWRGFIRCSLGLYESGLADISYLLRLDLQNLSALCVKGEILARLGRMKEAEEVYSDAFQHHPESIWPHISFARVLSQQGRHEAALAAYERVRYSGEYEAQAVVGQSMALIRARRHADAVALCEEFLSAGNSQWGVLVNAGMALLALVRYDAADRYLEEAIAIWPGREALVLSAAIKRSTGDFGKANERFREACEVDDHCTPFRLAEFKAIALACLGLPQAAVETLQAATPLRLPGDILEPALYDLLAAPSPLDGLDVLRSLMVGIQVSHF